VPEGLSPQAVVSGVVASFGDLAGDFDNLFSDVDRLSELEASSLDAIFRKIGVTRVLDCACGTGIQALGLARLGYVVAASDISSRMLDVLRAKASCSSPSGC
jgi:2-polyprenyl-3-methyl-5-hydroxy-6-metoxy-1,4-benzoquinol methylase